jgi:tetratricopeptide (TPR) repeat protein
VILKRGEERLATGFAIGFALTIEFKKFRVALGEFVLAIGLGQFDGALHGSNGVINQTTGVSDANVPIYLDSDRQFHASRDLRTRPEGCDAPKDEADLPSRMKFDQKLRLPGLAILLMALTLAIFWPARHNEFVNYDDPDYILINEHVNEGLSWAGAKWAFMAAHASNCHPLTWLSHMTDVSLFGLNPGGHHMVNLLFHSMNAALLFLLLHQMTAKLWGSTLVAALFALHPLHVESVAWVSERKDLLSAFFGLLTLMAYAAYASGSKVESRKSKVWYGVALVLFACGLMSKPMLVTWPFVMLLLDFWPLQRMAVDGWRGTEKTSGHSTPHLVLSPIEAEGRKPTIANLALEKIPFLLLAVASCIITLKVQENAMSSEETLPLSDRFGNAVLAYTGYLAQTFWPTKLAIFYPHVALPPGNEVATAIVVLLVTSVMAFACAKRFPAAFTGWFWFLGTLVPVIGIIQVGGQARADRYTYLPLIGIFIVLAWATAAWSVRSQIFRTGLVIFGVVALGACATISRRQLQYWRNSETLFTHALIVTQGNYIARAGLGIIEFRREKYDLAVRHLEQALEMVPPGMVANQIRYYIGATLQKQGKGMAALPYFVAASEVGTLQPEREYRIALSLIEAGRLDEAEEALQLACAAKPENPDFLMGRAALLHKRGKYAGTERIFQDIISMHPENGLAHSLYANFLSQANRNVEAAAHYAKAVTLLPNDLQLRQSHAQVLAQLGKIEEAIRSYEHCFAQQPRNPDLHANLAELLIQSRQVRLGIESYDKALQINPDFLPAINNLAWLLATHTDDQFRNGDKAVRLGEHACKLTNWNVPVLMGTLAAAYAEAKRFNEAISTATKARDVAIKQNQPEVAKRNDELLEQYKKGQPVRD